MKRGKGGGERAAGNVWERQSRKKRGGEEEEGCKGERWDEKSQKERRRRKREFKIQKSRNYRLGIEQIGVHRISACCHLQSVLFLCLSFVLFCDGKLDLVACKQLYMGLHGNRHASTIGGVDDYTWRQSVGKHEREYTRLSRNVPESSCRKEGRSKSVGGKQERRGGGDHTWPMAEVVNIAQER